MVFKIGRTCTLLAVKHELSLSVRTPAAEGVHPGNKYVQQAVARLEL